MHSRRLWRFIQLALFALISTGIRAEGQFLLPGDVIELQVYGRDDLSIERRIDGNGQFQVPLLGRVKADGLTPEALELSIADGLRNGGFLEQPVVSIYVVRRNDIFVDGDVERPGSYEWRSGLTIRQVIALAGGMSAAGRDELSTALQAYASLEALERTQSRIDGLRAREARLVAEVAFAEQIVRGMPDTTDRPRVEFTEGIQTEANLESIRGTEIGLLNQSIDLHLASIRAMDLELKTLNRARELLNERLRVNASTVELLRSRLDELLTLTESGLVRTQTVLDIQTALSTAESSQLELLAQITANEQSILRQQEDRDMYGDVLRRDSMAELESLRLDLAVAEAQLPSLSRAAALSRSFRAVPGELGVESDPVVEVQKISQSGIARAGLLLDSPVDPGDTLIVLRLKE